MTAFAPNPMTSLVDVPVRYDLAESTGPALRVRDLVDPASLADLPLGYGTSRRLAACDTRVAPGSWFGENDRVFRLGFGHLPPADFTAALARLAQALQPE